MNKTICAQCRAVYDSMMFSCCPSCRSLRHGPALTPVLAASPTVVGFGNGNSTVGLDSDPTAPPGPILSSPKPTVVDEGSRLMGFLLVRSPGSDKHRYMRLRQGVNIIGSGHECQFRLSDKSVSAQHALLVCTDLFDGILAIDLDSTNGIYANTVRVPHAILTNGSVLRLGQTELIFVDFPYKASPEGSIR